MSTSRQPSATDQTNPPTSQQQDTIHATSDQPSVQTQLVIVPDAEQQVKDRAMAVLRNDQLLMRYALANDLSVPKVRVYFEKVVGGYDPEPVIKYWFDS